jgi:pilus assembly protein CpaB
MNKQTLIILGGGFLAALLVAMLMQAMLGGSKPKILNEEPKASILVATKNLKIGDTLTKEDMKWQEWPQSSVFAGAITKDSVKDKPADELALSGRLRRNVSMGEPLSMASVVAEEKGNFVAATLGDGMRAMAIKVKAESSVGGFLMPNDRVDVVMTYEVRLPSDEKVQNASMTVVNKRAAQTILENIRIVAVDQKAKEIEEAAIARTVTLEVNPQQAEKLALAESMGSLSLALRKLGDETSVIIDGKNPESTTDIRMSNVVQELLGNDENTNKSTNRIVRVYNGPAVQDIIVSPYIERQ